MTTRLRIAYAVVIVSAVVLALAVIGRAQIAGTSGPLNDYVNVRSYPTITAAHAAAVTQGRGLLVSTNVPISTAMTVTVPLTVVKGGMLTLSTGITVTLPPTFSAGPHQVFSVGTGTIKFSAGMGEVYPEWWGAIPDGTTDNTAAINAADAALSYGGSVLLSAGTYLHNTTLYLIGGTNLIGSGSSSTKLTYTGAGPGITTKTPAVRSYSPVIKDLWMHTTSGSIGISLDSVSQAVVENVVLTGWTVGTWVWSTTPGGSVYNRFINVKAQSCGTGHKIGGTVGTDVSSGSQNGNTYIGSRANLCTVRGWDIYDSNDNTIFGSQSEAGTVGFYIDASIPTAANWNRIISCRAENNSAIGVHIASANVTDTVLSGIWYGSNGTDLTNLSATTRRDDLFSLTLTGNSVAAESGMSISSGNSLFIGSNTGQLSAYTNQPLKMIGLQPDGSGVVGNWIGNGYTLSTPLARIAGFCRDTAQLHAEPAAYIRQDGAYEHEGGQTISFGSGSPEGSASEAPGSIYMNRSQPTIYMKETGTGNSGWIGMQSRAIATIASAPSYTGQLSVTGGRAYIATGITASTDWDPATSFTLDEIGNLAADKTFTMGNKSISWVFTAPNTIGFELEALGGFTGDLMHVHQHTGNPGAGTNLIHFHFEDSDVTGLRITGPSATAQAATITGKVDITGNLTATNHSLSSSISSAPSYTGQIAVTGAYAAHIATGITSTSNWRPMTGIWYTQATPSTTTNASSDTTLYSVDIPGGLIGPSGVMTVYTLYSTTASTATRTFKTTYGGELISSSATNVTTGAASRQFASLFNAGSESLQVKNTNGAAFGPLGTGTTTFSSINTAVTQSLVVSCATSTTTTSCTLNAVGVEIRRGD